MHGVFLTQTKLSLHGGEKMLEKKAEQIKGFFDSKYLNVIYSSDIRPAQISSTDHLAISLKIKITTDRGPGIWKFNNSLLQDKNYTNLIKDLIKTQPLQNLPNAQTKQELLKQEIKDITIGYKCMLKQGKYKEKHTYLP